MAKMFRVTSLFLCFLARQFVLSTVFLNLSSAGTQLTSLLAGLNFLIPLFSTRNSELYLKHQPCLIFLISDRWSALSQVHFHKHRNDQDYRDNKIMSCHTKLCFQINTILLKGTTLVFVSIFPFQ